MEVRNKDDEGYDVTLAFLRQGMCKTEGVQAKDAWKCCGCRRHMQSKYFSQCDACWHMACDACIIGPVIYNDNDYWMCPCCEFFMDGPNVDEDADVDPNARLQQENKTEATTHGDVHVTPMGLKDGGACCSCRLMFPSRELIDCDGCPRFACDRCMGCFLTNDDDYWYCPCCQWIIPSPPPPPPTMGVGPIRST
jgi:hypothetical protein